MSQSIYDVRLKKRHTQGHVRHSVLTVGPAPNCPCSVLCCILCFRAFRFSLCLLFLASRVNFFYPLCPAPLSPHSYHPLTLRDIRERYFTGMACPYPLAVFFSFFFSFFLLGFYSILPVDKREGGCRRDLPRPQRKEPESVQSWIGFKFVQNGPGRRIKPTQVPDMTKKYNTAEYLRHV